MDIELRHILKFLGLETLGRFYSSYRGVVADNKDPNKAGRLKLKVPAIYGDDVHDYWALPKGIPNGNNEGMFWVPAVDNNVWVSFENGNPRFPVWEHGIWGKPGEKGNTILSGIYDDDGVPSKRQLTTSGGQTLLFDDKNKTIDLFDVNGQHYKMDANGIYIVSDKKIYTGTADASHPIALADELKSILTDLIKEIAKITVTVASVPSTSTPPLNAAVIMSYSSQLENILSKRLFVDK